jgi:hypothetical protein
MYIALILLLSAVSLQAEGNNYKAGYSIASPSGDMSEVAGGGGGLVFDYSRQYNENVRLGGKIGHVALGGIRFSDVSGTLDVQWSGHYVLAGGTYYLNELDKGFQTSLYGGVIRKSGKLDFEALFDDFEFSHTVSNTGWYLQPGVAFTAKKWTASLNSNLAEDDWTWLGFGLTYMY